MICGLATMLIWSSILFLGEYPLKPLCVESIYQRFMLNLENSMDYKNGLTFLEEIIPKLEILFEKGYGWIAELIFRKEEKRPCYLDRFCDIMLKKEVERCCSYC